MENLKIGDIVPAANGMLSSKEVLRLIRPIHKEVLRLIRPIHPDLIPDKIKFLMIRRHLTWLSCNTRCPCGSGKKFKACCMIGRKP